MDYLNYEEMVDAALLNVVKEALSQVSKKGLEEDHHFYISFLTDFPGVEIPDYIIQEFPEEVTIILQYEFWNLEVTSDYFRVDVNFGHKTETIKVPFKSLVHISDPSSNFELEFNPPFQNDHKVSAFKPKIIEKKSLKDKALENKAEVTKLDKIKPPKKLEKNIQKKAESELSKDKDKSLEKGVVVSLDHFRKK